MSRKKLTNPESANSALRRERRARRAKRASARAVKVTTKTTAEDKRNMPQTKALLDVAAQKRAEAEAKRRREDKAIGTVNWQWRKFALGLMNGLHNYKAYAEAYDMNDVERDERQYRLATVLSTRLLKNDSFRAYWRNIIVEQGFNDDVVDTEMVKLITDPDTPGSVRRHTIRDYNELTGRIVKKGTITDGEGKSIFDSDGFKVEVVRNVDNSANAGS